MGSTNSQDEAADGPAGDDAWSADRGPAGESRRVGIVDDSAGPTRRDNAQDTPDPDPDGAGSTESGPFTPRVGPRPIPSDRAPRPTAERVALPRREPAAGRWPVPPSGPPAAHEPGAEEHRPADPGRDAQPAMAEAADRRRPGPADPAPESDPFERADTAGLPVRERRHRHLLERPGRRLGGGALARPIRRRQHRAADHSSAAPARRRMLRTCSNRRARTTAPSADDPGSREPAPGRAAAGAGDRPGELGLRPESVARLSASGRELLARLQAELQGGGAMPSGRGPVA